MKTKEQLTEVANQWQSSNPEAADLLLKVIEKEHVSHFRYGLRGLELNVGEMEALEDALALMKWEDAERCVMVNDLEKLHPSVLPLIQAIEGGWMRDLDWSCVSEKLALMPLRCMTLNFENADDEATRLLEEAPSSLEQLTAKYAKLDEAKLEAISQLEHVSTLNLHGSLQSHQELRLLLSGGGLQNLVHLTLSNCQVEAEGMRLVARDPRAPQLQTLSFAGALAPSEGVLEVLSSEHLSQLTSLDVRFNVLDDLELDGVPLWALENVEHLGLGGGISNAVFLEVLESPCIPHLKSLNVENNKIEAQGLGELLERLGSSSVLYELLIQDNPVGNEGLSALAAWPGLSNLEKLSIGKYRTDEDEGYRAILQSPHLPDVTFIQAEAPTSPELAYTMSIHPAVAQNSNFVGALGLPTWLSVAKANGLKLNKSESRANIAKKIRDHNAKATPENQISPWDVPQL